MKAMKRKIENYKKKAAFIETDDAEDVKNYYKILG